MWNAWQKVRAQETLERSRWYVMEDDSWTLISEFFRLPPRHQKAFLLSEKLSDRDLELAVEEMGCVVGGECWADPSCRFCSTMLDYVMSMYGEGDPK